MKLCTIFFLVTLTCFSGAQEEETVTATATEQQPNVDRQPPSSSPQPAQSQVITITTPLPLTTTTAPPSPPLSAPTPPAFPKNVGRWSYNGTYQSPCIVLEGAFQIHIHTANPPANKTEPRVIDVPNTNDTNFVQVGGDCGGDVTQEISMEWRSEENVREDHHKLRFQFSKQNDSKTYAITLVEYEFTEGNRSSFSVVSNASYPFFPTTLQYSFRCLAKQELGIDNNGTLTLLTQQLQFQAFRNATGVVEHLVEFSASPEECPADSRLSTGVLIGVGVAMALFIGVVSGAYFIRWCRRRRRNGYQSLGDKN